MNFLSLDALHSLRSRAMTKPRTIGNMIMPSRFLRFLATLIIAVPFAACSTILPLGIMAGFDVAAVLLLVACASLC